MELDSSDKTARLLEEETILKKLRAQREEEIRNEIRNHLRNPVSDILHSFIGSSNPSIKPCRIYCQNGECVKVAKRKKQFCSKDCEKEVPFCSEPGCENKTEPGILKGNIHYSEKCFTHGGRILHEKTVVPICSYCGQQRCTNKWK